MVSHTSALLGYHHCILSLHAQELVASWGMREFSIVFIPKFVGMPADSLILIAHQSTGRHGFGGIFHAMNATLVIFAIGPGTGPLQLTLTL